MKHEDMVCDECNSYGSVVIEDHPSQGGLLVYNCRHCGDSWVDIKESEDIFL